MTSARFGSRGNNRPKSFLFAEQHPRHIVRVYRYRPTLASFHHPKDSLCQIQYEPLSALAIYFRFTHALYQKSARSPRQDLLMSQVCFCLSPYLMAKELRGGPIPPAIPWPYGMARESRIVNRVRWPLLRRY